MRILPSLQAALLFTLPMAVMAQFTQVHLGLAGTSLEAIDFPTPLIGYAAGKDGALYKSTDGGANWSPVSKGSGAYLFSVDFLDEDTGFVSGGGATVLRTMDGGANWTPLVLPFTECVYQVQVISATLVYAAGWGGNFFRSTNGGDNWSLIVIDPNWQGWVFSMDFQDADNGWVAQTDGRIYRTANGGLNWTESTTTTDNTLRGISMPDANTGYAAGFFGTVQKSENSGATWSTINTGYPGDSYYSVHFTDADHGVICGGYYAGSWQGVIMRTANGGSTWTRIYSGGPVLNGITINDGNIFAVGANEVIITDLVPTTVNERTNPLAITAYPNPFGDQLRITSPAHGIATWFELTTVAGNVSQSGAVRNGMIDTSALAPGCYVLDVFDEARNSLGVVRVVK